MPPSRRLPRQIVPRGIERDYARAVAAVFTPTFRQALAPLLTELPGLTLTARVARMDAGEGRRVMDLVARARIAMESTLSIEGLARLADRFGRRIADRQKGQLANQFRVATGADPFIRDRRLEALLEGFAAENAALIRGLSTQELSVIEKLTTRGIQDATPHREIAKQIRARVVIADKHAKFIARDQTGKLYGQLNAARQKDLGVIEFVWRTVSDERVRPVHAARNGQVYKYSAPPSGELPGTPVLCRCYAEPVLTA